MHLVQLLLPLYDPQGRRFPADKFAAVRRELTERFGGVTAYVRSPAEGLWQDAEGDLQRDDVVIHEVMVEALDREWWAGYRERLRASFAQEALVVRSSTIELL